MAQSPLFNGIPERPARYWNDQRDQPEAPKKEKHRDLPEGMQDHQTWNVETLIQLAEAQSVPEQRCVTSETRRKIMEKTYILCEKRRIRQRLGNGEGVPAVLYGTHVLPGRIQAILSPIPRGLVPPPPPPPPCQVALDG
ncbi:hypothetical protein WN51_13996 [Melipona quadrifasciata]|uniref:Uncharacterized protein n=1 Tax=Melipona quadrifasciata TaxID=166423 RepID=A0A0N0BFW0_9HYME|nr:hypothetical protein WN51_13996 [Melipona quadrifasciata]